MAPGKHRRDARRFLRFLRPHLHDRPSLGPDMGTTFGEIEALALREGGVRVTAIADEYGSVRCDAGRDVQSCWSASRRSRAAVRSLRGAERFALPYRTDVYWCRRRALESPR